MEKEVRVCPAPEYPAGYDKSRDKYEVSQSGYLDLSSAFANHCVPPEIPMDETSYNEVDDPSKVIGKPKDAFDMMQYNQSVHDYKPSSPNSSGE